MITDFVNVEDLDNAVGRTKKLGGGDRHAKDRHSIRGAGRRD